MSGHIYLCQPAYEGFLARELAALGDNATILAPGALAGALPLPLAALAPLVFAQATLLAPTALSGPSVNVLAQATAEWFAAEIRQVRFTEPWPLVWQNAHGQTGLGRRADAVLTEFRARLGARLPRVAKLAHLTEHGLGPFEGLFVWQPAFDRLWVTRQALFGGQARMRDDPAAPSRSYLKTEEAWGILQAEPSPGDTVVDLGAAPGGWSYSAAKRGAQVIAIDNGPLKAGAVSHPLIVHRRENAYTYLPPHPVTWLLADLVDDPFAVLELLCQWLDAERCRSFVVNLKFGRTDPLKVIDDARRALASRCALVRLRHLFHDREELTIVGHRFLPA